VTILDLGQRDVVQQEMFDGRGEGAGGALAVIGPFSPVSPRGSKVRVSRGVGVRSNSKLLSKRDATRTPYQIK